MALNYREYFIELLPKFSDWSLPKTDAKMTDEELQTAVAETDGMRVSLAHISGRIGRYSLNAVEPLLKDWAKHHDARVRRTVALAFEEAANAPSAEEEVLAVLDV